MTSRLCNDFPLRDDFTAQVVVPKDMTVAEAKRLTRFLESLVRVADMPHPDCPERKTGRREDCRCDVLREALA